MTDQEYEFLRLGVEGVDCVAVEFVARAILALKRAGFTPIELACAQNALDREFGL